MVKSNDKYSSPAYWTQLIQLALYENIHNFMESRGFNRAQLAQHLGVSKGYVSQVLNGDFDHRLSKLVELTLACGLVPRFDFVPRKYAAEVVRSTYLQPTDWKNCHEIYGRRIVERVSQYWRANAMPVQYKPLDRKSVKIGETDMKISYTSNRIA